MRSFHCHRSRVVLILCTAYDVHCTFIINMFKWKGSGGRYILPFRVLYVRRFRFNASELKTNNFISTTLLSQFSSRHTCNIYKHIKRYWVSGGIDVFKVNARHVRMPYKSTSRTLRILRASSNIYMHVHMRTRFSGNTVLNSKNMDGNNNLNWFIFKLYIMYTYHTFNL